MELIWLLVRVDYICAWITAVKQNEMTAWIVEWNDKATYAVGAEVGEMNRTQCSEGWA